MHDCPVPLEKGLISTSQARLAWPDKLFLTNNNVSLCEFPPAALHQKMIEMAHSATLDGSLLVFEISEDLPPTGTRQDRWRWRRYLS